MTTWAAKIKAKADHLRQLSVELEILAHNAVTSGEATSADLLGEIEETALGTRAIAESMQRVCHRERLKREEQVR